MTTKPTIAAVKVKMTGYTIKSDCKQGALTEGKS
jgi:hypothetical protein